jgi:hypothetical protein
MLFRMLKLSSADRYVKMTGREFEAEAKRVSPLGGVMLAIQRLIDPAHRVEHVLQAEEHTEDNTGPGDRPS